MARRLQLKTSHLRRKQWREVADQVRSRVPRLAKLMDNAEMDLLGYMGSPAQPRARLHSTNLLERLNGEIKRRSEVVGIFPNEVAVTRLVGALPLQQNAPSRFAVRNRRTGAKSFASMIHFCSNPPRR